VTTVLIGANWGLFIWAVQAHRLLEASFGYYINPLVNVSLGVWMLGERLRRAQLIAVSFALVGVLVLAVGAGAAPWVSLALAGTFAVYGLLRKTAQVDALVGLFVETLLITPVALLYLAWLAQRGALALTHVDRATQSWVAIVGVITSVPLLWFTGAARRLRLSTLGFFQYIAPTCQMIVAVSSGETVNASKLAAFALIWSAIAIYSAESIVAARR
jgi:chloramphenicol-sensitive protein RarD